MMALSSTELKPLLVELRELVESQIMASQNQLPKDKWTEIIGSNEAVYMANKDKRQSFYDDCERIAKSLNKLSHKLIRLDQDMDMDFDVSSITWSTTFENNPNGLELVFYPKRTELAWSISSFA